jgi:hypothetical protein
MMRMMNSVLTAYIYPVAFGHAVIVSRPDTIRHDTAFATPRSLSRPRLSRLTVKHRGDQ